jgi:hypothetical protein
MRIAPPIWRLAALAAIIGLVAIAINNMHEKRSREKRNIAYQATLRSYSEVFKPGMTRKEVEGLLRSRNNIFRQMWCVDIKKSVDVWDDLVKIAQEDAPWVCSEKNIYIAFQFTGTASRAEPSDTLISVTVYPWLEGCL